MLKYELFKPFPKKGEKLCLFWLEYYDFNKNEDQEEEVTPQELQKKLKDIDDRLYENLKEKIESIKSNQQE